jgi:hypothetical protein
MGDDCPICCNSFTKVARKAVGCSYCNYDVCVECVKKYILSIITDPNCMNCKVGWSKDFMDNNLSKAFRIGEYKKHREIVLLDRERSLLPDTIQYVEIEVQKREQSKLLSELTKKFNELMNEVNEIKQTMHNIRYNNAPAILGASTSTEKKIFVKACIMPDCRGYLSTQWKCGVCSIWVCPDCHEQKDGQKDENHKCNPDTVATAQLIAKDSKPCPKCTSLIYKLNGCSQMWCTICHTTFDWNTGKEIITTNIHNPEYYRYIREHNGGQVPRNIGDVPMGCGGLPTYTIMYDFIKKYSNVDIRIKKLNNIHRIIGHIRDIEMNVNLNRLNIDSNRDLRISYLLKDISEEEWKKELQKREKRNELQQARRNVYEMFITVATDLLTKLVRQNNNKGIIDTMNEISILIEYYNESIASVADRFNSKAKKEFNDEWLWM